jgi:hypothetical protein
VTLRKQPAKPLLPLLTLLATPPLLLVTLLPLRLLLQPPALLTQPRLLLLTQPLLLLTQPLRLLTLSRTQLLRPKLRLTLSRLTPRSNIASRKGVETSERPAKAGLSSLYQWQGILIYSDLR